MNCPLCNAEDVRELFRDKLREYVQCHCSGLVFVPEDFHISLPEERRRYDLHCNNAGNTGYVRFLAEVADVVAPILKPGDRLLDFGCGKESVLTKLLAERGFNCSGFDPLYEIGPTALDSSYDGVILCEVIEHLRDLAGLPSLLCRITKPHGPIVIRTRLCPPTSEFANWWYKNDITHINFFSQSAIDLLARKTGRKAKAAAPDIFVFSA